MAPPHCPSRAVVVRRQAPDWLPDEEEFDDVEPEPLPVALVRTEEPEIPDARLKQAELPVNWWAA